MEEHSKNIGIKVKLPIVPNSSSASEQSSEPPKQSLGKAQTRKKCNDKDCPFHGSLKCRGKIFTGVVISTKMQKTATVDFERRYFLQKYERYEKRRTRIKAHNPECINAKDGDIVRISECRPLSKTKNFVVIENLGKEKGFEERREALEESKTRKEVKEEAKEEDASDKSESN